MTKEKVLVLGMARSGYEAAKLLAEKKFTPIVNDMSTNQNPDHVKELHSLGIEVILGSHPDNLIDESICLLVKNPGISNEHKYVKKAIGLSIPVINEMELAYRYFPKGVIIIGITGTNGKTTTTTLVYEFLKSASKNVHLAGNIGFPVCSFLPLLRENDIISMEVSDHQLCNVKQFKTDISVLTNLYEAHIDFHGTYGIYKSMKKRIFNHHSKSDVSILNYDNKEVLELTDDIKSTKKYFSSTSDRTDGCSIKTGYIYYENQRIIATTDIKIKGQHNYENVMAAIMAVKELNVDNEAITNVLRTFNGVEHRLEYVRTVKDIEFYNDSKATNITSTQKALGSFSSPTIILMGGLDRGHSFEALKEYMNNVIQIVAYGETKDRIADFAQECRIPCEVVETLDEATHHAYYSAKSGYTVLLSPACASWDQFADFEARGTKFKECVNSL